MAVIMRTGTLGVALTALISACAASPYIEAPPGASAASEQPTSLVAPPAPAATYHFMRGYQAELAHDIDAALREYQTALQSDPHSSDVKSRLAALYFGMGDLSNAARYAEEAGEGIGHDARLMTQMAGILAGSGKPDEALQLLDRAIEQEPERAEPYFSKSIILLNVKRVSDAEEMVTRGLQYAQDSPLGHYHLGRIYVETGRSEQAIASFERAIAANPSFEPAYLAQSALYESQEKQDKAIAVLQRYLRHVNPRNKDVRQHLVQLYIATKDYAGGLTELEKMVREDPTDLDAQLRIALIYGEKKEFVKAVDRLTVILQTRPNELKIREYLAYLYEEMKEFPKAIETYRRNIQLDSNFLDSHLHLGALQFRLKNYSDATAHLSEAVRLNPKQPEPHIVLGLSYLQSEQFEQASRAFEEGLIHNPQNADLHFNLGTAYDKLNRFEDVVRAMETALSLNPQHADALNYLGYSYADRGIHIEQALSLTKRAVAIKPENGYYVDSLAWAFYKSGMLAEALKEIQRAITLVGDDPVIYEHLGEIYVQQNNITDAREAWMRSLELDPSNEKLAQRFREKGMGDPAQEERIRRAKIGVSEKIRAHQSIQ